MRNLNLDLDGRLPELPEGYRWKVKINPFDYDEALIKIIDGRKKVVKTAGKSHADFSEGDLSYVVSEAMALKERTFGKI